MEFAAPAILPQAGLATQPLYGASLLVPEAAAAAAATPTAATAYAGNTLGVGFSGSGFLIMYFVGVTAVLKNLGVINTSTKLAGASGGSVAAAYSCGVTGNTTGSFKTAAASLANSCNGPLANNCRGTLDTVVKTGLLTLLPASVTTNCANRLFVSVTRAVSNPSADTEAKVAGFTSRNQVLAALAASSYIPRFSGARAVTNPTTSINVPVAYDGVGTNPLPVPPSTSGVTYTVTVSALANGTNPPNFSYLVASANANPNSAVDALFGDKVYLALNPTLQPQPARVDIYPGLSGPLAITNSTWNSYVLIAPDNATLKYLYEQGQQDAKAWVLANLPTYFTAARVQQAITATPY